MDNYGVAFLFAATFAIQSCIKRGASVGKLVLFEEGFKISNTHHHEIGWCFLQLLRGALFSYSAQIKSSTVDRVTVVSVRYDVVNGKHCFRVQCSGRFDVGEILCVVKQT